MKLAEQVNRLMGRIIALPNGRKVGANVVGVLTNEANGKRRFILGFNCVTNDGDEYYAESGAAEVTSWSVVGMRLGTDNTPAAKGDTDVTTFLAGSGKNIDGSYPTTSDPDGDNSGAGADIVSWRVSYTTGEANGADIYEGAIVDHIVSPTKALCHWVFGASFTKTSSDTLKVFVNHEMAGQLP